MRRALLVLTLAAALLGQHATRPASADENPDARRTAAVFVIPETGTLSRATRATLQLTMENALASNRQLRVADVDARMADRAGRVPWQRITAARSRLAAGSRALERDRAAQALADLETAATELERVLAFLDDPDELVRAQFLLAAAHAVLGQDKQAAKVFRRLASWRPDYALAKSGARLPDKHSAAVSKAWREAADALAGKKTGSLRLESEPSGAMAFVDGRFVGFTPTTVEDLRPGAHYITYRIPGFYPVTSAAEVTRKTRKVSATMEPAERADQVDNLARAVAVALDSTEGPRALLDLRDLLGVDHAIFVRVPSIDDEQGRYLAAVFETSTRRRLALVEAPASDDIEALFHELARSLYANIAPDSGLAHLDDRPRRGRKAKKPIYKRWWFWTGIAATAAAGVGVPLYLMRDGNGGGVCPDGATCGQVSWRFF